VFQKKWLHLGILILAGEAVFMLPFMLPRLFRPMMLEEWGLSNQDIGLAFSAYGTTAVISYFFGGPLADKFQARGLIAVSLFLTAAVGSLMLWPQTVQSLMAIYALFGVSTILFLWGALIKLTHDLAGPQDQATMMGLLDGGRGLAAALVSSALVVLLALSVSAGASDLKIATGLIVAFTGLVGVLAMIGLPRLVTGAGDGALSSQWSFENSLSVLKNKQVWALGLVVFSAYSAYKNIDLISIYLVDVKHSSPEEASTVVAQLFWLRPLAAILAGLAVDRLCAWNVLGLRLNRLKLLALVLLLTGLAQLSALIVGSFILFCVGAYALRAIYFSVFDELAIPHHLLGTTIGLVSVVGFLPDMVWSLLTGALIDHYSSSTGYALSFGLSAGLLLISAVVAYRLKSQS
jgi:sugar phosphate permease